MVAEVVSAGAVMKSSTYPTPDMSSCPTVRARNVQSPGRMGKQKTTTPRESLC